MDNEPIASRIPLGMRIIAILNMLGGSLVLLAFIFMIILQMKKLQLNSTDYLTDFFLLGYGILSVVTGRALIVVKPWAFRAEMLCIGIQFLYDVFVLVNHAYIVLPLYTSLIRIFWDILFFSYFVFNKNVRAVFRKENDPSIPKHTV